MSIDRDVVYGAADGRELRLDLYRPEGDNVPTRTAVLMIHGGGWVFGDRSLMAPLASQLAEKGFLAVAVEYRLAPQAPWPAQREDVIAAARWVANNANQLGIDADRIVVLGNSAGGQLAMLAAAELRDKPRIAAVISLFTASELTVDPTPQKGIFNAAMLLGEDASDEAVRAASPLHQLTADFPPVYLLHGGKDWLIDPVASLKVYQKLTELGVPAELHIVAGAHHEFASELGMCGPMTSEIALFLNRILVEPERWAAEAQASNIFVQGPEALQAMMAELAQSSGKN